MSAIICARIERALADFDTRTALFFGERLVAEHPQSDNARLLLARALLNSGRAQQAVGILRMCSQTADERCRLTLAHCLFVLQKYIDAELVLYAESAFGTRNATHSRSLTSVPCGAAGFFLLGLICKCTNRTQDAVLHFQRCLQLDSMHFAAFEELCGLGIDTAADVELSFGIPFREEQDDGTGDGIPQSAGEYGDGDMIESFGNSTMMSGVTGGSTPAAAIGGRLLFDSTAKKHMSIAVRGGNETPATPNARAAIDAAVAPLSSVSDATAPHGIGNRTKAKPRARVSFGSAAAPRRLLDTPLTSRGISVTSFPTLSSSIAHASGHNEVGDDERTPVRNSMVHHRVDVASAATPAAPLARPHTTRAAGGVLSGVASAAATATAAAGSTAAVVDAPSTVNFLRSKPAAIETGIAPGTGAAVSHGASISTATAAAFSIANTRGTGYNSAAIDVATAAAAAHDLDQLPSHEFAACVDACARAVQAVHMYRCSDALATIDALPAAHRASAAVQALAGRACFEMAAYARACDHYARALRAEPERVDACGAHHSSALWQLRRDAQLAALAHRLQASSASTTSVANAGAAVAGAPASGGAALGALFESNFAPTPWQAGSVDACLAAGNCFSLQREHELALRMFRKASEIDAQCAYAHTLAAHEHAACEDFEKAVAEYRHAIRIDERHYNAWYGLGHVYFRQEKHQLAIYHFQRAIAIHPRSPVLHCYLGMVLHDMRCGSDAVRVLRRAAALEPHASQARFQLALVLLSQRRHDEALVELNAVCAHAPREAAVHAALGRAYRAIGCVQAAVVHWTRALDLDPKDRARVKAMLDRVGRRGSGSGSGALEASDEDDEDNDDDENDNDDDDGILHDSDLDAQEGDEDECDGGDDGDEGDEEIDDA